MGKCLRCSPSCRTLSRRTFSGRAISRRLPRAWRAYSPALTSASGSTQSSRWCGISARSAALGLAVPISNSRYIATESQLTISLGKRRAIASDNAVFPLAVGPNTTTSKGSRSVILRTSTTSAHAPRNVPPVADEGENEQKHRHEKQSRSFGGVDRVVVLMLVLMLVFLMLVIG